MSLSLFKDVFIHFTLKLLFSVAPGIHLSIASKVFSFFRDILEGNLKGKEKKNGSFHGHEKAVYEPRLAVFGSIVNRGSAILYIKNKIYFIFFIYYI